MRSEVEKGRNSLVFYGVIWVDVQVKNKFYKMPERAAKCGNGLRPVPQ
jgi:hypothetical protein